MTSVVRNDNGTFSTNVASLVGLSLGSLAWGDYDNDGDLDLAVAGQDAIAVRVAKLYRNDGGSVFVDSLAALTGVSACSLAWGDYDNDGDLDLVAAGQNGVGLATAAIYRNDPGTLSAVSAGLTGVYRCSAAWGDYDNDGDLDLALAGQTSLTARASRIYSNDDGSFVDIGAGLAAVNSCSTAWGDYDGDGDLDLVLVGYTGEVRVAKLYRNDGSLINTPPSPPTGVTASLDVLSLTLTWNQGSDARTPPNGLCYNVRVGSSPGAGDVFCAMADSTTGYRRVPAIGNAQKRLSWTVQLPGSGHFYYSVQAIDTAFAGSCWAAEGVVAVAEPNSLGAKGEDDGTWVSFADLIVHSVFGDSFYAETPDRFWGILVECPGHGLAPGAVANFTGTIQTNSDRERYIRTKHVSSASTGIIEPLAMTNASVGGGPFGLQQGIDGAGGLSNIGLLVRTWGTVTDLDPSGDGLWFAISDGSGVELKCETPAGVSPGPRGTHVAVTGACSCTYERGVLRRLIRVRTQQDITPF